MLKKFLVVVMIGLLGLVTAACGKSGQQTVVQEKDRLTVVTSFYPMYIDTINITRGIPGVKVVNMTKPQTGCLHDYQIQPEDMKTLDKANVFVINGAGMENFLDKVIKQLPNLKVIEASKDIPLLIDEDTHDHDHDHDKDNSTSAEVHEHGEGNPHLWVSVSKAILQVKNIGEQMAAADPEYAEQYKKNTDEYVAKLETLSKDMHSELANISTKDIITFHEAFPYFAEEFGLNLVSVIEREPGTEPTPQELKETIEQVKKDNVKALFIEPQYPSKSAQVIADETGAKVYVLDPAVTGEAKADAYDDYLKVMRKNAETLKEALK